MQKSEYIRTRQFYVFVLEFIIQLLMDSKICKKEGMRCSNSIQGQIDQNKV